MKFSFETTEDTYEYCMEVVECLRTYCGKSEEEAVQIVNMYWEDEEIFGDDDFRLHEAPYYWAMCIAHDKTIGDNRPNWDKDPALWPPPKDFLERWYGSRDDMVSHKNWSGGKLQVAKGDHDKARANAFF